MAHKETITTAEALLYLGILERDMMAAKQKLLQLEFLVPDLTEEQRQSLSAVIREGMQELANERLPAEFRERIPPILANRVDELFKLWLPDEQ